MKTFRIISLTALLSASLPAATFFTDPTAFFASAGWTGAPAGTAFTENFVASGGLYNFTGNEEFVSNSYTYGAEPYENTLTYARLDGAKLTVDTSNQTGALLSFDDPNSSKYLYVPANGNGEAVRFSFSQPVSSFGLRIGDLGDPTGDPTANIWTHLWISARDAQSATSKTLASQSYINVLRDASPLDTAVIPLSVGTGVTLGDDQAPNVTLGDGTWFFVGWTFDSPVDEITVNQTSPNNDSWGIDTVSFTTAVSAVPEPGSSLAILALLGGGLAFFRSRRILA